jgi:hypothetical protein
MTTHKWEEVFPDPDTVCQTEYRAVHDLMADVAEMTKGFGDPDPEAEITEAKRNFMVGVLDELVGHAEEVRRNLRMLKY